MCCYIKGRQRVPKAARTVYKVYKLMEGETMGSFSNPDTGLLVRPPCFDKRFLLFKRKFVVSNRKHRAIQPNEIRTKRVHNGIHVYLTKEAALRYIRSRNFSRYVIVECLAKAEDFVCQTLTKNDNDIPRAVYHKILPIRIGAIKDRSEEPKTF